MNQPTTAPYAAQPPLWTLIGPGLGTVCAAFQTGLLLALAGTLQREYGLSVLMIGAVLLVQLIAAAAGLAPGFLLGRRAPIAVVSAGLALMLIGALMATLSGTPAMLIVAELLAGLGAGAVVGAAAALSGRMGARQTPVRLTLAGGAFAGLLFGLVLSWLVTAMLSWRLAYVLLLPMTVVALIATGAAGVVMQTRNPR